MRGVPALRAATEFGNPFESVTVPATPTVVFVAIAVAVVLGGALLVVWSRRRSPAARLRRRLRSRRELAVVMHPNPDPDAMACALAVKQLAEQAGTDATLYYPGEIRHPENRAFRTVLDLDLTPLETSADIDEDAVVLVDHNQPRGFVGSASVEPFVVIDHHPGTGVGTAFTDVRTGYGACATIFAEYFETLGADSADEDDPLLTSDVATGLLYGILSDTNHLTRGVSAAEFEACSYLYPAVDDADLDRIANPQVDAEVIEIQRRAIEAIEMRPPYAISDVGTVDNLDAIPWTADELMHFEGISSLVVLGEKDETIYFSGRSRDDRVHMGRALERAVADIPMSGAGGHARMGGGQVSVAHMNGIGPSEGMTREEFRERLFDVMVREE